MMWYHTSDAELRIAMEEYPVLFTEAPFDDCDEALKKRRVGDEDFEVNPVSFVRTAWSADI